MPAKLPRVVFDTNVFISAILFGGNPRKVIEQARTGETRLITSKSILLELAKKLHEKFGWEDQDIKEIIESVGVFAEVVSVKSRISKIKADPADNKILECAKDGKADFIISGDRHHILPLKKFGNAKILSPTQFLERR